MVEITEKDLQDVPLDNVNHPSHYETGKFECIDVMLETQGEKRLKPFVSVTLLSTCTGTREKTVLRM